MSTYNGISIIEQCSICLNRTKKEEQDNCDHCPHNEAHKSNFELDKTELQKKIKLGLERYYLNE